MKTQNLALATTLLATGHKIIKTSRDGSGRVTFEIETSPHTPEVIERFHSRTLQVDARTLLDAYQEVKTRIYN